MPAEFWRVLLAEHGIVVYPSALAGDIAERGLAADETLTEAYEGHIVLLGRCGGRHPPPCPMELIQEPPPPYVR